MIARVGYKCQIKGTRSITSYYHLNYLLDWLQFKIPLHAMRSLFLFSALALVASVLAQDIDSNDVPSQCKDACASVVSLTARCDNSTHDDDSAEMKCVCNDPGASKNVPNCAACLDKYGKDGKDNGMFLSDDKGNIAALC